MTQPRARVMINGWYGHANAGDDAILEIFIAQAVARLDCDVVVLSERPENIPESERVSAIYHPFLRSFSDAVLGLLSGRIWRHAKRIRTCDLFVLGGGGLLRDNTSWRNLVRLLDEIWLCRLFGKPVMLYAIGVGPFKTRLGRFLIGRSANMCDLITVRSEGNAALLRSVGVPAERIHVVADPAFLLGVAEPADAALRALVDDGELVGLFPTISLLCRSGDEHAHIKSIAHALDRLHQDTGMRFAAFAMRYEPGDVDDVTMSHAIRDAMAYPEALVVYDDALTPQELKWVTSKMRLNITVRLHAMIFSAGANVPVVAVNYEPKVGNVFATFKAPQFLVEMDGKLDIALYAAVRRCTAELETYSHQIAAAAPQNISGAIRTFELMEALCRRRRVLRQVNPVDADAGPAATDTAGEPL